MMNGIETDDLIIEAVMTIRDYCSQICFCEVCDLYGQESDICALQKCMPEWWDRALKLNRRKD